MPTDRLASLQASQDMSENADVTTDHEEVIVEDGALTIPADDEDNDNDEDDDDKDIADESDVSMRDVNDDTKDGNDDDEDDDDEDEDNDDGKHVGYTQEDKTVPPPSPEMGNKSAKRGPDMRPTMGYTPAAETAKKTQSRIVEAEDVTPIFLRIFLSDIQNSNNVNSGFLLQHITIT